MHLSMHQPTHPPIKVEIVDKARERGGGGTEKGGEGEREGESERARERERESCPGHHNAQVELVDKARERERERHPSIHLGGA
jgi:hypothetical protein